MLRHLAKVDHQLVFRETHQCLHSIVRTDQVQSSHFTCVCRVFCIKALQITFTFSSFQVLSFEDLQRGWCWIKMMCYYSMSLISYVTYCFFFKPVLACMFLEDSTVGREVWRQSYLSLLNKVSELFPFVLQQESLRDGQLCYIAVKVAEKCVCVCFVKRCVVFITDSLCDLCC